MSEKRKKAPVWKKLLLLLGATLFMLLLGEGAIRVYSAFWFPKLMTVDAKLGWRHAPDCRKEFKNEDGVMNLVVQNEFGHRGKAYGKAKDPSKFRVLVLGDSFTEAVHVAEEELFTRLLEKKDASLEVLNAGVGAWGTVQQLLYLRDEGLTFAPDLVLLMYYENDLVDNCISYSPGIGARPWAKWLGKEAIQTVQIVEDYDDAEFLKFVAPVPFRGWLARNSYLFYALNERVYYQMRKDELRRLQDADREALDPAMTKNVFKHLVVEIKELCDESNVRCALALIPDKKMIADGSAAWHDELGAMCAKLEIPCLSLLPAMVAAQKAKRRPYFDKDIHWAKAGHVVAAEALLPFVQEQKPGK